MAERTRGLPPAYDLNVPQSATRGPVQLGDYLEEEDIPPVVHAIPRQNAPATTLAHTFISATCNPVGSGEPLRHQRYRLLSRMLFKLLLLTGIPSTNSKSTDWSMGV